MKKQDKRKRSYKKVYKNNKPFVEYTRTIIFFILGSLYLLKLLLIRELKNIVRFIVGVLYLLKTILKAINTMNIYLFNLLSKPLKIAFIYALIIGLIISTLQINILRNEVQAKEREPEEQEIKFTFDIPKQNPVIEEQKEKVDNIKNKVCENKIACDIYTKALFEGLTTEQAILLVSISKHETGNWTSKAFLNKNNLGGICNAEGIKSYSTFEEGLEAFINLLKNRYFNKGLNTIEQIGNIYCPIGADNDPGNKNIYWIPTVTQFYNEYLS